MDKVTGATQTYVARAWYRDTATLFNLASFLFLVLQEQDLVKLLPERYHGLISAVVVLLNLWIRFQSSTRPVALSQGMTREVHTIPLKGTGDGNVNPGSVSDTTRTRL